LILWKKENNGQGDEDIPEPRKGLDENFDLAN
jgi:hypothetical protein